MAKQICVNVINEAEKRRRGTAAATGIYPGCVLTKAVDALTNLGSAAEIPLVLIAVEADYLGNNYETAYASGEQVPYIVAQPGDIVYLRLAAGETAVASGAYLKGDSNGTVQTNTTTYANTTFARALEAVDNSGGSSVALIKAEIIEKGPSA